MAVAIHTISVAKMYVRNPWIVSPLTMALTTINATIVDARANKPASGIDG
jgi:hypothetical protein